MRKIAQLSLISVVVGLLMALLFNTVSAQTLTEIPGRALATINLRAAPSDTGVVITRVAFEARFTIEARNQFGNWLLVRLADGTRGWAAARFVGWSEEIELGTILISFETFGDTPILTPAAPAAVATAAPLATVTALNIPEGEAGSTLARLNVRQGPAFTFAVIGTLDYRTRLVIEARNGFGDWLLVQTLDGGLRGWVASRYVSWRQERALSSFVISDELLGDAVAITGTPVVVSGASANEPIIAPAGTTPGRALVDRLNVRAGAGVAFGSVGQMPLNERVLIEARSPRGDWLLVRTLDDRIRGWVASRFIGWSEAIDLATFVISDEVIPGIPTPTPGS